MSARLTPTPFIDYRPLEDFITTWAGTRGMDADPGQFAQLCGVDRQSVLRWRASGQIPLYTADRVACRFRIHPSLIYGDVWWDLPIDEFAAMSQDEREVVYRRRRYEKDRDAAEFARVIAAIDPSYMRGRLAEARAYSTALRTAWRQQEAA